MSPEEVNEQHVKLEIKDKVATVLLDRPDKGNALSPEVMRRLETVFIQVDGRADVNVVVLTGGERYFSAGFDLEFLQTLNRDTGDAFLAEAFRVYKTIMACRQPVIAAVGGAAVAGGFDLAAVCDVRYASERARFGQREIALSVTMMLDPLWRVIGLGRALEAALTGRIYDAHEAERMGLVSRVFPEGHLLESVAEVAGLMASYDRDCLIATKQLGRTVITQDLAGSMNIQEWLLRGRFGSEENKARIEALLAGMKKK